MIFDKDPEGWSPPTHLAALWLLWQINLSSVCHLCNQVIGLSRNPGHTGTIQPVYRSPTSYNGMTTATELGMAPSNSAGSDGALTGLQHFFPARMILHDLPGMEPGHNQGSSKLVMVEVALECILSSIISWWHCLVIHLEHDFSILPSCLVYSFQLEASSSNCLARLSHEMRLLRPASC